MIIFFKASSHLVSHSPGNWADSGSGLSDENQCYHSLGLRLIAAGSPVKVSGNIFSSSVT